jgi:cobalt-zinc-cadmium efflux system outer membrane protein
MNLFRTNMILETDQPSFLRMLRHLAIRPAGRYGLFLFLIWLFSSPLLAEPVTLTEKQAIALFYQRNLDLLLARYNIENAMANEIIASAIPNPTLSLEVYELSKNPNQILSSNAPGAPGSLNVGGSIGCTANASLAPGQSANCGPGEWWTFSQLIEMAGKRGLRMQSAAIATQAAESDFRDAVRIFTNMVRGAYYNLLQTQKNRWLSQEIVNYYKEIVQSNRLQHQAGAIAESDLLRIEIEAMQAQSDLDNADAAIEQAQATLAVILNWPDKSMQFLADEHWPEIKDIGQNLPAETLLNKALALRPDLQGDKQRADQADKDLIHARRLKFPDITINAGEARDPGNNVLNTYFVGVSIPLPVFYQYQGQESQSAVNLNQMRLAAEQTELTVRSDVENSLASWKSSDFIVKRYESELLERARQVRERLEMAYNKGGTTVLDFIQAQRDYKSVMLDYYTAATNRINAYYNLAKALGVEPDAETSRNLDFPIDINSDRQRKIE